VREPRPTVSGGADVARVYALYRKQRSVSGSPRFDVKANLAGDETDERLVVHGRDLVVFGEGYLGGRGFAAVTLAQFDKPEDILRVTTRDVSGSGKHDIVVEGVIRQPLPEDIGKGTMQRRVVMVYKLKGNAFDRVFAAELSRTIGKKSVSTSISFVSRGRIELKPGKAVGFDEQSYPWSQQTAPEDGFEPLLLPWGGVEKVRLRYDGTKFAR
jgi:hypothetical protein